MNPSSIQAFAFDSTAPMSPAQAGAVTTAQLRADSGPNAPANGGPTFQSLTTTDTFANTGDNFNPLDNVIARALETSTGTSCYGGFLSSSCFTGRRLLNE